MPTIDVSRNRIEGAFDRWDRPDDVASAFLRRRPFEAPSGEFFLRGSRGGSPAVGVCGCVGVGEWTSTDLRWLRGDVGGVTPEGSSCTPLRDGPRSPDSSREGTERLGRGPPVQRHSAGGSSAPGSSPVRLTIPSGGCICHPAPPVTPQAGT